MRSPSAKVLKNRVNVFIAPPGRDTDGGVQFPYAGVPTISNLPCTAQPQAFLESIGADGRITQVVEWKIMFGRFVSVSPRDVLVLTDAGGTSHTIFVEASRDEAGRDSAYTVRGIERL